MGRSSDSVFLETLKGDLRRRVGGAGVRWGEREGDTYGGPTIEFTVHDSNHWLLKVSSPEDQASFIQFSPAGLRALPLHTQERKLAETFLQFINPEIRLEGKPKIPLSELEQDSFKHQAFLTFIDYMVWVAEGRPGQP